MSGEFWPEHCCIEASCPSGAELDHFRSILIDARDERPVQNFFGAHPHLLACFLPPGRGMWCFDRPRFGSELIPDFLLCTESSEGKRWVMVELESPTKRALTQAATPSKALNQALMQVDDWRIWIRANIAYAQHTLGFSGLDAECPAIVVIGRRDAVHPRHAARYRELSNDRTMIMSYDRLLDAIGRGRSWGGYNE